ncbi:UNVERIFIED_CONTAM: hypothetical protein FKN15_063673 [Acipenser sinensis]
MVTIRASLASPGGSPTSPNASSRSIVSIIPNSPTAKQSAKAPSNQGKSRSTNQQKKQEKLSNSKLLERSLKKLRFHSAFSREKFQKRSAHRYHTCADLGGVKTNTRCPPKELPSSVGKGIAWTRTGNVQTIERILHSMRSAFTRCATREPQKLTF